MQGNGQLYLTWFYKGEAKKQLLETAELVIGRKSTSDIYLQNPNVSRQHARVTFDEGAHYIEDLDSSCGTLVDGRKLDQSKKRILRAGSEITIANVTIWCVAGDSEAMRSVDLTTDFYTARNTLPEFKAFKRNLLNHLREAEIPETARKHLLDRIGEELAVVDVSLRDRIGEHRVLHEIAADICRILDVDELLLTVLKLVCDSLGAERGLVLGYDQENDTFMIRAGLNAEAETLEGRVDFSRTIAMQSIDSRRIVLIADAINHQAFSASQSVANGRVRSVACIPLLHNHEILGVIYLDNRGRPDCFREEKIDFLKILSVQVTTALINARLYTQATTDDLTGLASRNIIEAAIYDEMKRAARYVRPCSLIMMDLDHFKSINDTYGHPAGDYVLRKTAEVIRDNVRDVDSVGRFGGEEFVILLPETEMLEARALADRIRNNLKKMDLSTISPALSITASFGVSSYQDRFETNPGLFLELADQALYAAKDAGRDCVITTEEPTEIT